MAAHAKHGPSNSALWLGCAGAIALAEALGLEDTGSDAADEGTAAHEVGEKCLKGRAESLRPKDFVGTFIHVNGTDWEVTEEMAEAVEVYVNHVLNLGGDPFIEERVDFSAYVPEGFGTADCIVEYTEVMTDKQGQKRRVNVLEVADYKHGKGIYVSAFDNSQGKIYAIGALETFEDFLENEPELIRIRIVQPRKDNIGTFDIWKEDLLDWAEDVLAPAAALSYDLLQKVLKAKENGTDPLAELKDEHFTPGVKQCQWCKAGRAKFCKKQIKRGYEAAVEGFEDLTSDETEDLTEIEVTKDTLRSPATISKEELVHIYLNVWPVLKKWGEGLKDHILERLMDGEEFEGLKPVMGEGKRVWALDDEQTYRALKTAGLLKADFVVESLITPPQAEKIIKKKKPKDHKKRFAKLERVAITRAEGKPEIAFALDARPSLVNNIDEDDELALD